MTNRRSVSMLLVLFSLLPGCYSDEKPRAPRTAAQLLETSNLRIFCAQINEEATHHDVVVALAGRGECCAQRLDRVREDRYQGMLKWRTSPTHQEILG